MVRLKVMKKILVFFIFLFLVTCSEDKSKKFVIYCEVPERGSLGDFTSNKVYFSMKIHDNYSQSTIENITGPHRTKDYDRIEHYGLGYLSPIKTRKWIGWNLFWHKDEPLQPNDFEYTKSTYKKKQLELLKNLHPPTPKYYEENKDKFFVEKLKLRYIKGSNTYHDSYVLKTEYEKEFSDFVFGETKVKINDIEISFVSTQNWFIFAEISDWEYKDSPREEWVLSSYVQSMHLNKITGELKLKNINYLEDTGKCSREKKI